MASLVVFMLGFSLGFGGLPFLLLGELFPAAHRSQLAALASAVNLLSMFTVIKTYHSLDVSAILFYRLTSQPINNKHSCTPGIKSPRLSIVDLLLIKL